MTQKPKISLIIIAFNEEKYIGDCLEHAIKNGGEKFHEIIVVDNASTDCTSQIASAFPHVKVIYEKEKGITKARQRGLKEAQGEILAFIDADARIPKGWYEIIEKEFSRVDEKGKEKIAGLSGPYIYHDIPKSQQNMIRVYWWLAMPLYLLIGYMATGGNFAMRKTVLEKMGGFDTRISFYGEDTDTARRASKFGKVKFNHKFFIHTSGRRFAGQGLAKTAWLYIINFLSNVAFGKAATKEYVDYR